MQKRAFFIAVLILLVAGLAWAGGDKSEKSGKYNPAEHAAKMQKELGLTNEQTEQVQTVFEETHAKIADLKASGKDEATIKAEKMKLKEAKQARLQEILTSEQWAKYQEMSKKPVQQAAETQP